MKKMNSILFLTYLACFLIPVFGQFDPIVGTKYGRIRGESITLENGDVIDSYLGIPFAKPPVGDLRFTPPQEPDAWNETYQAVALGDACMQPVLSTVQLSHLGWDRFSEDCLHINIYTPKIDLEVLLPVMVFIHGGGYQGGANFVYPGYFLAQRNVVVVTVNYRLGVMGFSYTGDGAIGGNMGLLDQIQALKFVQENICVFRGDASKVTVFGESAGASSVGLLMMSPLAEGLFHGSILQSGCELTDFGLDIPAEEPEQFIYQVALQFDCPLEDSVEMVSCLREVNARQLSNAEFNCTEGYECGGFRPVVDGTVIPDLPENLRESGDYIRVPEMIGVNQNDSHLFLPGDLLRNGLNRSEYDAIIWESVSYASAIWPYPSRMTDVYEAVRFHYARDMLGKLLTDTMFGYPADLQAKSQAADGQAVYYYIYDYIPENYFFPEWMGAFHGTELLLLFGWPDLLSGHNDVALNHSQAIQNELLNFTAADAAYADFMITLWTNFARYGNPTPVEVEGPEGTVILWPEFENTELYYLDMKPHPEVNINYRQEEYAFWTEYVNYLIYGDEFQGERQYRVHISSYMAGTS